MRHETKSTLLSYKMKNFKKTKIIFELFFHFINTSLLQFY